MGLSPPTLLYEVTRAPPCADRPDATSQQAQEPASLCPPLIGQRHSPGSRSRAARGPSGCAAPTEPAAALGLAALRAGLVRPRPDEQVALVLCGANVDPAVLATPAAG